MHSRARRRRWRAAGAYATLVPFLVLALFPFYWMIVTSLKSNQELISISTIPFIVTQGVTWEHYSFIFRKTAADRWLGNTLVVAGATTAISLVASTLAAYAITRMRFRGSSLFSMGVFVSYLVPPTLLFIPLSQVVAALRLSDRLGALIVTYPTFAVPFSTWLLMSYFQTVPKDLEESATVDGATRLQALWKIVLPVSLPGLVTVTLFSFTLSWGQLLYPVAFISSSTNKVLTAGLETELIRADVYFWGSLMGGALLASVPVIIAYSAFTGYFVSGLVGGATKY
jgi:multiple sugar transport system permease protein